MWLPKSKCSQDLWSAGDQILAVNEVTDVPFPQWTIKATPCDPHAECRDARGSWGIKDDQRWSKGKRDQWPDDLKSHLMWPDVTWMMLWACEILWIQGVAYWKRWRIRTCWDSRPAGECLLPPKGQVERILMLWHLPWKSLSHPALFMPRLCVYDYLGLFGIVCVFISRLAWLCSDSSSSVWLEVEETKSDWTLQLPQFLSQFSLCFPCASFMGCGSFQSLEWSRVSSRGYINRGL